MVGTPIYPMESFMKITQAVLRTDFGNPINYNASAIHRPNLVFVFGSTNALREGADAISRAYPDAVRLGCSTAGEISTHGVDDDTLVVTALLLEKTKVIQSSTVLSDMADSHAAGQRLAKGLPLDGLRAVMVFGQGVKINGSGLLLGMIEVLGTSIPVTGGLAGDGGAFAETWVLDNCGISSDRLTCIGLYGDSLMFSHGSFGGWVPFGPARKVTRCETNVLFELDGEPALQVYKRYLGDHAKDLPASGLLFPFAMLGSDHSELGLTRTILGVDEATGSLTLAGDIDPDGYLKLMHSSTDSLVDGAETAAQIAHEMQIHQAPGLALLVSCVGRKLVMGGRVDEEVEAVGDVFGQYATLAGFYSYGEISPVSHEVACKLHNQTMTITYIAEAL